MSDEPIMDVAHLGHLELLTPKPDESLRFFVDVMGMTESGRKADSVFLRAWDDYEQYLLQLTAANTAELGHASFRARSAQAFERRVKAIESSGAGIGWIEDEYGHGPAYRFRDPDGHMIELYYETQWYQAPEALRPALKNQAQRYPARGVNVRRLDHFNCLAVDIRANREFFQKYLGFRLTEQIVMDSGEEGLSSDAKCNTPGRFYIGKVVQDLKECCHAILFASVGGRKRPDRRFAGRGAVDGRHCPGARSGESYHLQGAAAERTPFGRVLAASRRRSLSIAQAA
jgi:catechol 2,3-dioxygenase-like lactoylglutathione lyase family enzyme